MVWPTTNLDSGGHWVRIHSIYDKETFCLPSVYPFADANAAISEINGSLNWNWNRKFTFERNGTSVQIYGQG